MRLNARSERARDTTERNTIMIRERMLLHLALTLAISPLAFGQAEVKGQKNTLELKSG
jgi:hypothetical protein